MKVLIVHRYFWPSNLSTYAEMLRDIAEDHCAQGDDVAIFTAYADPDERAARDAWAAGAGVALTHVALPPDRGRHPLGRLWAMLVFTLRAVAHVIATKPDALVVTSYPILIPAFPLAIYARLTRTRLLFHVQDIFTQNLRTRGGWRAMLGHLLHRVERGIVRAADVVVTLSGDMKAALGGDDHIVVRQNYTPNAGPAAPRTDPPGPDGPVLIYAGNMGVLQHLPHFLDGCAIAHRQGARFRVRMLGAGSMLETLEAKVAAEGLSDFVSFDGLVTRDEAAAIVAECDIGVVSARRGLFTYAYPSKVFTYWKSGLPVLVMTEADGALATELAEAHLGRTGDPVDADRLARDITALVDAVGQGDYDRPALARTVEARYGRAAFLDAWRGPIRQAWLGDQRP